jgi:CBS domain-containing protein
MKISDIMTDDVALCSPDDTIQDAAQMMADCDCGFVPVGANDRLIGVITDRDIVLRAVAEGKDCDCLVRDVMSSDVKYCYEDQDIEEVMENMADQQIRRLPVVTREKRLIGIVSLGDLSQAAPSNLSGSALKDISRGNGTLHAGH